MRESDSGIRAANEGQKDSFRTHYTCRCPASRGCSIRTFHGVTQSASYHEWSQRDARFDNVKSPAVASKTGVFGGEF